MKDKAIFILSLILVVVGVTYLGYTSYQFFTRKTTDDTTPNEKVQTESTKTSISDLTVEGSSNKELIGENLVTGDSISLKSDIKNNSTDRVSTNLEGRVYKITDLYTFPDVDKDIPVNIETIPVAINGGETSLYSYTFITSGCGNFYMALASADFWKSGRGLSAYGYFTVDCVSKTTPTPTPAALPSVTKGEKVEELPKAGAGDNLVVLGVLSVILGFTVKVKYIK